MMMTGSRPCPARASLRRAATRTKSGASFEVSSMAPKIGEKKVNWLSLEDEEVNFGLVIGRHRKHPFWCLQI